MVAAYGDPHLQNPAELPSQEVAPRLSHHLSLWLSTMESRTLTLTKGSTLDAEKDSRSAIEKNNGISD